MKTRWTVYYLLLMFLVGCSTKAPHFTPLPEASRTSVPTGLMATPTLQLEPAPTGQSNIVRECLEISTDLNKLNGKNYGKIIFDRDSITPILHNKLEAPYLYELGTNQKKNIDPPKVDATLAYNIADNSFFVSPDRTSFVYHIFNDENNDDLLVVADRNGETLATHLIGPFQIESWERNGVIFSNYAGVSYFNPYTVETKGLRDDFPNRYQPIDIGRGLYGEVHYDPSLTKALYFARESQSDQVHYYIAIWDTLNEKEIARYLILPLMDRYSLVDWSLDGQEAIFFDGSLVSLHINGEVETLLANGSPSFALSPDGKKLAFWLTDQDWKNWSLSVFDRETKTITDYCIKSVYFPAYPPLWSPDSQNLVIYPSDDLDNTEAILIDREQNFAVRIAENAKPVGWLK
jgi:hypothetical protein